MGNIGQGQPYHLSRITTSWLAWGYLRIHGDTVVIRHANAVRTCRDPQQFGLPSWEKDEKTSSLLKRILTFNCYRLLQFQLSTDYSDYSLFTSHGSLSESSQVNSMGLRMCTSEALRWANFAFVADGESSKSPKGEPLLRNWNIWWTFGFRNNFFKVSENTEIARLYKLSKLHKTAMIYEYNVVLTVRCIETTVSTCLHCLHRCPSSAVRERVRHNLGFRSCLDPFPDLWSFSEWVHNHVAQLLDLIPNLCPATKLNATHFRTAIEQSYGSYWIYNSTWPYKVEACIHMYTYMCTKLHKIASTQSKNQQHTQHISQGFTALSVHREMCQVAAHAWSWWSR